MLTKTVGFKIALYNKKKFWNDIQINFQTCVEVFFFSVSLRDSILGPLERQARSQTAMLRHSPHVWKYVECSGSLVGTTSVHNRQISLS